MRIGSGVDIHKVKKGTPCYLAGLLFPEVDGCESHSDGDVAVHAICDALLAAAGLGDLGTVIGVDKKKYQNVSSLSILTEILALITANYVVNNVTVQIIATEPKVGPRRQEAEVLLSGIIGAPVTVGATTTDGLGLIGVGSARAAMATALLSSKL